MIHARQDAKYKSALVLKHGDVSLTPITRTQSRGAGVYGAKEEDSEREVSEDRWESAARDLVQVCDLETWFRNRLNSKVRRASTT